MADEKQKPAEKIKSHAEAKRLYDSLAKQCGDLASRLPKIRVEIERRVKEEMGQAESQLAEVKAKKAAAARDMFEAEQREAPERQAKALADAEAKRTADQAAKAKENAERQIADGDALKRRMAEASA